MKRHFVSPLIALLVLAAMAMAAQKRETYQVRLSPVPTDIATRNNVAGKGSATATLVNNTLSIAGSFEGLPFPATVARLHQGKVKGIRGPAVADLVVSKDVNGTITGSVNLTPEQIAGLRNGRLYIQIHNEKAPDGNLWGWLLK